MTAAIAPGARPPLRRLIGVALAAIVVLVATIGGITSAYADTPGGIPIAVTVPWSGTLVCTDTNGFVLGPDPVVTPGQRITCVLTGFIAGESVHVVLVPGAAGPTTTAADANGTVRYTFAAPADFGPYTLTFIGQQSQGVASFAFVVGAVGAPTGTPNPTPTPSTGGGTGNGTGNGPGNGVGTGNGHLAATGADAIGFLALGGGFVVVGAVLSLANRRRRAG